MGEGLEKVSKISLEKIEDTIKKIEGFSHVLQRYKNKEVRTKWEMGGRYVGAETAF